MCWVDSFKKYSEKENSLHISTFLGKLPWVFLRLLYISRGGARRAKHLNLSSPHFLFFSSKYVTNSWVSARGSSCAHGEASPWQRAPRWPPGLPAGRWGAGLRRQRARRGKPERRWGGEPQREPRWRPVARRPEPARHRCRYPPSRESRRGGGRRAAVEGVRGARHPRPPRRARIPAATRVRRRGDAVRRQGQPLPRPPRRRGPAPVQRKCSCSLVQYSSLLVLI